MLGSGAIRQALGRLSSNQLTSKRPDRNRSRMGIT